MTLAEKILLLRTQQRLSQDDLAERMGVSRQSVRKWETAQSTPDLDKIIRLANLFGVTVDELVREENISRREEPQPSPQTVYVEKTLRTPAQILGIIMAALGLASMILGLLASGLLVILGLAAALLSLPLLLAKKHPWLITGWLAAALSCLALNPYTSVSPWGLMGGLRYVHLLIIYPELRYGTYYFAAVGLGRGLLTLALLFLTWRAWKSGKS